MAVQEPAVLQTEAERAKVKKTEIRQTEEEVSRSVRTQKYQHLKGGHTKGGKKSAQETKMEGRFINYSTHIHPPSGRLQKFAEC